jgi:hypothetical protein
MTDVVALLLALAKDQLLFKRATKLLAMSNSLAVEVIFLIVLFFSPFTFSVGCFTPTLNMYNSVGGKEIGKIKGPTCCIAGCCGSDFDAKSPDGNSEIAEIRRGGVKSRGVARSLLSTSDKYSLSFKDPALSNDDKLVLISSVLFLDYLFFEGETECLVNCCVCPPQCWFKLCEFYFCGCSLPCRVRCCVAAEEIAKKHVPG